MQFIKALLLNISLFLLMGVVHAQDNAPEVKEVSSSSNMLAMLMIIIALVLAFVIYAMGQVLVTLTKQVMEKNKLAAKTITAIMLPALTLFSLVAQAQEVSSEAVVKVVPNYGGLSAAAFWMIVAVVSIEVIAILFMLFLVNRIKQELIPVKENKKTFDFKAWWARTDKKLFTKAVAVEKEQEIILEHEYDGIKELDNSLPPWWKYGFMITIGIAFFYLMHFHVLGSGKNPTEEYQAELETAKLKIEAYEAKNKDRVDEKNITLADAAGIADGKDIFQQNCWACHGKMGEGGAGPNLTDDYWLHNGSLTDIYHSIKTGYPDKGMQAWEKQFSPKQISNLTSYIKSLKGSNPPNAKAPQGDEYIETTTSPADSSNLATETQKAGN